jgi:hypothetical protein
VWEKIEKRPTRKKGAENAGEAQGKPAGADNPERIHRSFPGREQQKKPSAALDFQARKK